MSLNERAFQMIQVSSSDYIQFKYDYWNPRKKFLG